MIKKLLLGNNLIDKMESTLFSGFVLGAMTVNISNNNIDCCSNAEGLHYLIQNNQTIDCLLGSNSTSTTYSSQQSIDLNNDCLSGLNLNSSSPKNNVGMIVGCVIGMLVLIIIALIVGFLIYRRKKVDLLEGKTAKEFVLNSNADMMESSAEYTTYGDEAAPAWETETDGAYLNNYDEVDPSYHITNEYLNNNITETYEEYGKDLNNNITETGEAYLNGYDEDSGYYVANEDLDSYIELYTQCSE
eukprot:Pgem_evm1s2479